MTLTIETEQPPLRIDNTGTVRVGATRVTLDTVINAYQSGASAETIVSQYSTLKLADVYAVIAYYLRHRDQVDAYLHERGRDAEEVRRKIESDPRTQQIRERLLARREAQDGR